MCASIVCRSAISALVCSSRGIVSQAVENIDYNVTVLFKCLSEIFKFVIANFLSQRLSNVTKCTDGSFKTMRYIEFQCENVQVYIETGKITLDIYKLRFNEITLKTNINTSQGVCIT